MSIKRNLLFATWLCASLSLQAQVPQAVVVEHFTNTYCSVCANRNPGFYTNLANHPQVWHIAFHPSSPYPACPLNQHNKNENDARTNWYGVYGSTPRIVLQGNVIPAAQNYGSSSLFTPYLGNTSSFDVVLAQQAKGTDSIAYRAVIRKVAASTLTNLQVYGAIVEDTLFFQGNNGEPRQYDVFRKSMFGQLPLQITAPTNVGDSLVLHATVSIHNDWSPPRIYGLLMVQEANKQLVQAARSQALGNVLDVRGPDDQLTGLYPNPPDDVLYTPGIRVFLFDVFQANGRLAMQGESLTGSISGLAGLPPGVYGLRIIHQGRVMFGRFVKP